MTREEAENRINDLAWQIRDVILEYNPKETYFTLNFSEGTTGEAFSWLSYWNLCSYKEDGSNKPLENHCPIPNEEMVRYRESLKEEEHDPESNTRVFLVDGNIRFDVDSQLADSYFGRFIDRIAGAAGEIDIYLDPKEDWE